MLYADDACIVSRSLRRLERVMAVSIEVFGTFGFAISESKTETLCMPITRAHATQTVLTLRGDEYSLECFGLKYHQTTSFAYLGGAATGAPNLSAEVDRGIRAGG